MGGQRSGFGGSQPSQNYRTESVPVLREREIMQPPVGDRAAVIHIKASELGITSKPLSSTCTATRRRRRHSYSAAR